MIQLAAKPVLEIRQAELLHKTNLMAKNGKRPPHLSVVLIGDDPASQIYVSRKGKMAESVGFTHESIFFPQNASVEEVKAKLQALNQDPKVDGILIQRPLPPQFDEKEAVFWVSPKKDVDCLHPENIGLLVGGNPRFLPCTPAGVLLLLDHYQISVAKKTVCVIGRSAIVGKPLASMLLARNASVIQIHRSTPNPQDLCKLADVVFVAAGAPKLVNREWIKKGAAVIDIGIHRDANRKVFGDVDSDSLQDWASAVTPVPGGVGPMTIQVLLENTFKAASL